MGIEASPRSTGILRLLILLGPLAAAAGWLVIGVSWWLNRGWFVYTRDAFSDLGGSESCCPQVYNYGLMIVGALVALHGVGAAMAAATRSGVTGGAYMALAGVFLALIGVFPSGTRPHVFVSTWFFVQADLALLLLLWEAYRVRRDAWSLAGLALAVLAFPVAGLVGVAVGWPSAAVLETYGVLIIDVGVLAGARHLLGLLRRRP